MTDQRIGIDVQISPQMCRHCANPVAIKEPNVKLCGEITLNLPDKAVTVDLTQSPLSAGSIHTMMMHPHCVGPWILAIEAGETP